MKMTKLSLKTRDKTIIFLDWLRDVPYVILFAIIGLAGIPFMMFFKTDVKYTLMVMMLFGGLIIPIIEVRYIQNLLGDKD